MNVDGKVVVVTGAASGIGLALAWALSERGCRLTLADIDLDRAQAAAEEIGGDAFPVACDVSDRDAVEALADAAQARHGDVDIVFNNAGVMPAGGSGGIDADPSDLDWVLAVNVVGTWNGCSVFGKRLAARPQPGWIVNTASEHALGMQHPGQAFYTASKHAILGLSDVLRAELPDQVGISVLCPGMVRSELWNSVRHRAQPLDSDTKALLPFTKAVMDHGMPAVDVARKAIAGIERGDFLIVTHAASRPAADRRSSEVGAAFDAQAPYDEGWQRYDLTTVIQAVLDDQRRDAGTKLTQP